MQKPWLAHYPPGVPAEIDPNLYRSIDDVLARSVAEYRDRPVMTNFGTTLSYAALDIAVQHFAAYLQSVLGLKKGERVALMMPNVLQYPVCIFGALRAGLVVVNVNPLYTARELEHQLKDSGAVAIVVLENFAHVLEQVIARTAVKHVILTGIGDLLDRPKDWLVNFVLRHVQRRVPRYRLPGARRLRAALAAGTGAPFHAVALGHDDLAFLQYTGGTTGVAKGAELTHGNIVANIVQAEAWFGPFFRPGRETVVTALPLYHIFSLTANCLLFVRFGALNVLITNPRDFDGFVKELSRHPFSVVTGVNTLFNALLHHPGFARLDFSNLRLTLGGGMAVQEPVARRWKEVTGHHITQAYGLTETSPAAIINPMTLTEFNGTIGVPIPSTEAEVRDADGRPLPPGEPGELCLRGPQVTRGYWNRPDETAKALGPDGFFATGDIATLDEQGFVRIVDRKKDMIVVSGFKVFPNEVEEVIAELPGVREAAAIGVPDEATSEAVKVFVVRSDPSLTAERIIEHCRAQLTRYKVPKQIEFRDQLPKTNVGKILRRALRDEATPPA
ncbi:MAG TPA: AMP-binding protein [Acidiferrobacterales bacterium]